MSYYGVLCKENTACWHIRKIQLADSSNTVCPVHFEGQIVQKVQTFTIFSEDGVIPIVVPYVLA
jgi:hypothetical protein